jgi:preprotein translocase subunit YajC
MTHFGAILQAAEGTTSALGQYGQIILMVVIMGGFFFFMIRNDKKKKKQQKDMRDSIKPGDDITTIGGIIGKVVDVSDDTITFETSEDRVRVKIAKWAIASSGIATEQSK